MQHSWLIHYLGKAGRANTGCPKQTAWEHSLAVLAQIWTSPLPTTSCHFPCCKGEMREPGNTTPRERLLCTLIIFCSCASMHDSPGEVFRQQYCQLPGNTRSSLSLPYQNSLLPLQKQHPTVSCITLHTSSFPWHTLSIFYSLFAILNIPSPCRREQWASCSVPKVRGPGYLLRPIYPCPCKHRILQVYWHILHSRLVCGPVWAQGKFVTQNYFYENFWRSLHLGILPRTYSDVYKLAALMQDAWIRY